MSEMTRSVAIEDASFARPSRHAVLVDGAPDEHVWVDLLTDRRAPRQAPEGTVRGCAALTVLVVVSCLVGGVTGGLVVIGVSTLLAAGAALVGGRVSLSQVGGPRGAGLFLGVAVAALLAASVTAHDQPAERRQFPTALVQVSAVRVPDTRTTDAAVPPAPVSAPKSHQGSKPDEPSKPSKPAKAREPAPER